MRALFTTVKLDLHETLFLKWGDKQKWTSRGYSTIPPSWSESSSLWGPEHPLWSSPSSPCPWLLASWRCPWWWVPGSERGLWWHRNCWLAFSWQTGIFKCTAPFPSQMCARKWVSSFALKTNISEECLGWDFNKTSSLSQYFGMRAFFTTVKLDLNDALFLKWGEKQK